MTSATETQAVLWPGASGTKYKYWVYELPPNFSAAPGNYIFAKLNSNNRWVPVYIGQTGDLSERFDEHHVMPCIRRNGATHIHAHKNTSHAGRVAEERDLLGKFATACNRT